MADPVTFAQFIQQDATQQNWSVSTAGSATTITATSAVYFFFSGVPNLPFSGPESAIFSLTATSNQTGNCGVHCGPGDSFVQPGYTGIFSFMDTGAAPETNLLSGTFSVTDSPGTSGAQLFSSVGSSGAGFSLSNGSQLTMTSAYLTFPGGLDENASFGISSLIPNFATGAVTGSQAFPVGIFDGSGTGTFSSMTGPAEVAEPWTLGMIGAGLFGLNLLRKRRHSRGRDA